VALRKKRKRRDSSARSEPRFSELSGLDGVDEDPVLPFDSNEYGDVTSALTIDIETLLHEAAKIHGLMQRWSEVVAERKRAYMRVNAAKDLRHSQAIQAARRHYARPGMDVKPTAQMIDARAKRDRDYVRLLLASYDAQEALDKAKGVVDALSTKASLAKAALFTMGQGDRVARSAYTVGDEDGIDVSVDL